jgi:hypothetical protein
MTLYCEKKGIVVYPEPGAYGVSFYLKPASERMTSPISWGKMTNSQRSEYNESNKSIYCRDIDRNDPVLIEVVQELGSKKASCNYANLTIVNIPDDVLWEIDEYDGYESVAEKHRKWG